MIKECAGFLVFFEGIDQALADMLELLLRLGSTAVYDQCKAVMG